MVEPFKIEETSIKGLWKLNLKLISDDRGSVMEFFRESDLVTSGLPAMDLRPQINAPMTIKGAVRGIHAEFADKYVAVASGKVFAVIVDLRKESPTRGRSESFELSRGEGLFVSEGLGNSFQSISDEPSVYLYCFAKEWTPGMPGLSCNPLDPDLDIQWPIAHGKGMIISDKDLANPSFKDLFNA